MPGDVAARSCQARDQPAQQDRCHSRHDDWDRPWSPSWPPGRRRHPPTTMTSTLGSDQLGCELGKRSTRPVGVPLLEDDVLALDVAGSAGAAERPSGAAGSRGALGMRTHPVHLPRLLRLGGERRGEQRRQHQQGTRADPSLDHLVRPRQQRRRDRQAEGLGRLEVDQQIELGRLRDGKVAGLAPLRILST